MEIEIDAGISLPVYEQIVKQITQGVQAGSLLSGESLPSIRQLASDLELNHNTVAKAYKLLEKKRVIVTAGRHGTLVHENAAENINQGNNQEAVLALNDLVSSFNTKGISHSEIRKLLAQQLSQLKE
jgi:GntR family transcriptional regulator